MIGENGGELWGKMELESVVRTSGIKVQFSNTAKGHHWA